MGNHLTKKKIWCYLLGVIIFRLILDVAYKNYISYYYSYAGFLCEENTIRYVLSWLILLVFSPFIINLNKKIVLSNIIIIMCVYFSVIPFTSMVAFFPFKIGYIVSNVAYWLWMFLLMRFMPLLKFKKSGKNTGVLFYTIIAILSCTVIYISFKYTGFRIKLNIEDVYSLRLEASEFAMPSIFRYLYSASKTVNIIYLIFFLSEKNVKMVIFLCVVQILSFSIDGSKTIFFSLIIAVMVWFFYKRKHMVLVPWIFSGLSILSVIVLRCYDSFILISLFIRRIMFLPNLLYYRYYSFFSNNEPDYFQSGILRHFGFESSYSSYKSVSLMLGELYYGSSDTSANTGFIGDACANLGLLGVIIMPVLIVFVLKLLDSCSKGINEKLFIVSAILIASTLMNSSFFTILLTHGLIAVCLVLYLLPRNE